MLGYNNINYDNVLSQAFLESELDNYELVSSLYDITQPIFDSKADQSEISRLRRSYLVTNSDIMTMYYQSGFQKPLKMLGVLLGHDLIYEGNIESRKNYDLKQLGYDTLDLLFEDKKMYNINDVLITDKFWTHLSKDPKNDVPKSRMNLSMFFNIDFYSDSESSIANKLISRLYTEELLANRGISKQDENYHIMIHLTEMEYRGKTTRREKVLFKDAIVNVPDFQTKYLNSLLKDVLANHWTPDYNYNNVIHLGNVIGKIGVGGIHLFYTDNFKSYEQLLETTIEDDTKKTKLKATQSPIYYKNIPKGKSVREIDVASLYPATWINSGLFPEHLSKEFLDVYRRLRDERIQDKKAGRSFDADWKKLVLNATWGKTMNEYTLVADPKVGLMITMTGQLVLLQLIERLLAKNIKVLLSNTDSVVVELDDSQEEDYYKIIKTWEDTNNYELEETIYSRYFARDVNCYLGIENKGKIKKKNDFNDEVDFKKGMDSLIVSKAVKDYLLFDISIEKTIKECKDLNMFIITYKPDSKFIMEYVTLEQGSYKSNIVQRINRWYISKTFGKLFSGGIDKKGNYKRIDTAAGYNVRIVNNLKNCTFDTFAEDINYNYYIAKATEMLNKIELKQIGLWKK